MRLYFQSLPVRQVEVAIGREEGRQCHTSPPGWLGGARVSHKSSWHDTRLARALSQHRRNPPWIHISVTRKMTGIIVES